jgi:hypothetical protein
VIAAGSVSRNGSARIGVREVDELAVSTPARGANRAGERIPANVRDFFALRFGKALALPGKYPRPG